MVEKPVKRGRRAAKVPPPVSPQDMDEETAIKHYLRLAVQVHLISLLFTAEVI